MPFDVKYDPDLHCLKNILTGNLDTQVIGNFFSAGPKVGAGKLEVTAQITAKNDQKDRNNCCKNGHRISWQSNLSS